MHQKTPSLSKAATNLAECEATTKTRCHTIPSATQKEQAVSMATTAFLSNAWTIGADEIMLYYRKKKLHAALHCSICWASKYLTFYDKDVFHLTYFYKMVGFSSSVIYKCIHFGLENPRSGFHDNRSDFWGCFFPLLYLGWGRVAVPFQQQCSGQTKWVSWRKICRAEPRNFSQFFETRVRHAREEWHC